MTLLNNFIEIFIESAPWLMLGLTVAGFMKAFVPEDLLARHLGKPGFLSTVKAALLGAPLPLCSCGVIPAAVGLRRSGASKAATTSFLISTPETGVDSISISYALLGPFMAVIRPIAAIASAITAGVLVGRDDEPSKPSSSETSACCASKAPEPKSCCDSEPTPEESCCSAKANSANMDKRQEVAGSGIAGENADVTAKDGGNAGNAGAVGSVLLSKLKAGLRFTFIDLVRDISLWLLIGLGFAALIKTFVPTEFLAQWGDGLLAFIVMAVIGVPMYICATASTPIAAGLLFSGVTPGAVLVFMLVGPATNIATVGLVKRELGNRALAAYLGSVVGVGFAFGFLTNYLAKAWNMDFLAQAQHAHEMLNTPLAYAASLVLAILMMYSLIKKYLLKGS